MKQPPHFIIIRLSAMGDVAMIVPIIRALSQQYPQVKITVVSRLFFKPFFQDISNVNFFAFDDKKRHKKSLGILKLFWDLRHLRPDYYVDLHNVLRTKIIGFLFKFTGVKTATINKKRHERKAITAKIKLDFKPIETVFDKQLNAFTEVGYKIDLKKVKLADKANLDDYLKRLFDWQPNQKFIGIAPFAQYQSKIYPLDLMQIVIDKLANNSDNCILLFGGGSNEIVQLEKLAANHQNVKVVAGKAILAEELMLISNLDVMLSMDSGNAHIAAMLGVKVITLWGATHPFTGFLPFGQPLENCMTSDRDLYPQIPTSVFGNKVVTGYEDAMRTILPDIIIEKIEGIAKI